MDILKIGIRLTITNESIILCKKITSPLLTKNDLYNKQTTSYLRDLSLLGVEHNIKLLRRVG